MRFSSFLALSVTALALVLTGCDIAGSENTVILNTTSPEPPVVEYMFFYPTDGSAAIEVRSEGTDDLTSILKTNGFRRSDVVSARIDSVELERISNPETKRSVFDYLSGATVHLGPDADAPRIAQGSFQTADPTVRLPVRTADVTNVVENGETPAFLRLDTADDVPDRRDRVAVTVHFRIEVQGV